jgi:hypothetical protein
VVLGGEHFLMNEVRLYSAADAVSWLCLSERVTPVGSYVADYSQVVMLVQLWNGKEPRLANE